MIKLNYLKNGTNFGDTINYQVFSQLFNQSIKYAKAHNCTHLGMGSVLNNALIKNNKGQSGSSKFFRNIKKNLISKIYYDKPIYILGSGFIDNPFEILDNPKPFRNIQPVALRGKITLKYLEELTGKTYDCALGDAGIFIDEFLAGEKIEKSHTIGIVPHMYEKDMDVVKQLAAQGFKIIDIEADYMQVIKDIASCKVIASSSLHGLVASDSLNIPNIWIKLSDRLIGDDFKFKDYYSAYNTNEEFNALDMQDGKTVLSEDFIKQKYKLNEELVNTYKTKLKTALTEHFKNFK